MRVEWRASAGEVLMGRKRWGVPRGASAYFIFYQDGGHPFLTIAIIWTAVAAPAIVFSYFGIGPHASCRTIAVYDLVIAVAAYSFVVFEVPMSQSSKSNVLTQ